MDVKGKEKRLSLLLYFGKILNLFPYSTLELDLFCVQNENNNANNVEYHIHNNVEFPPFWNI